MLMIRSLRIPILAALGAAAGALGALGALGVVGVVGVGGCAPIENYRAEEWRWAAADPEPVSGGPLDGGQRVRVFVAPELADLMRRLEPRYEAATPGVDLEVVLSADLDVRASEEQFVRRINAGAACDALLSESAARVLELTARPRAWAPIAVGEIVVIAPAASGVSERDMLEGRIPVAVALERTGLGRASRLALTHAGVWDTVVAQVGRVSDTVAALEAIAHAGAQDPPADVAGLVYRSAALRAIRTEPDPRRRITILAPLDSPPDAPIVHVAAVWTDAGRNVAEWLRSDAARSEMAPLGFTPVDPAAPGAAWRTAVTLDDELLRPGPR